MKSLSLLLALLAPALSLAVEEVRISGNTLTIGAPPADARTFAQAARISFKSSTFIVGNRENLNDFRAPSPRLYGQRGLERLLLVVTCGGNCDSPNEAEVSRTVWVNLSDDLSKDDWEKAAVADGFGLRLQRAMFRNPRLEFAVNGSLIQPTGAEMPVGNSSVMHYYIQVFEKKTGCRRYLRVYGQQSSDPDEDGEAVSIDLPWRASQPQTANGIVVGAPKVYDSYALAALRNTALTQMQAINPFVPAAVTGAYGNLQGVTRDQSYTNVQGQYAPPQTTAPVTSVVSQTATCPPGYYPAGSLTCAVATSAASNPLTATANSQTITPSTSALTPAIPSAPAFNSFSAPANVGQSASDTLVEQVQLSAQLQVYQLLLQGARSDTLLVENSRAVAKRAQTTIGFPISIDPPRQFRHAVAEVRILIEPFPGGRANETPPISIVNLLPSQKTYNVAKITSNQHSFGASAVIDQVASVGASAGKAKDRLYLAKDTDTIALQYDNPAVKPLRPPLPEHLLTGLEEAVRLQRLEECDEEFSVVNPQTRGHGGIQAANNSVRFGWQFRPVLGADYVAGGPRQVFAQLALPEALNGVGFQPAVFVETRWREYDEKRQVVGPVFRGSCTLTSVKDPVIIEDPLRIHDVTWDDTGNGVLKIRAHGSFFSPAVSLQSGGASYPPASFNGHDIQFLAPAKDLLVNGDLNLLAENSATTSLAIPLSEPAGKCGLAASTLWAIPQADGSARVRLALKPRADFVREMPGVKPLVLIGGDVYGLTSTPMSQDKFCDGKGECIYHFSAPADNLRAAVNYYVRDIAWNTNSTGAIRFAPVLAKLSPYGDDAKTKTKKKTPSGPAVYLLSGSDLKLLDNEKILDLRAYASNARQGMTLSHKNLTVWTDSEALLTLPRAPLGKTLTIAWTPASWPLKREAPITWDLTLPGQETAPSLTSDPASLFMGDSRTVTYSGKDFSNVQSVTFEGSVLNFKISPDDSSSMDVMVPGAVTNAAGHKELVAITKDKKGKPGQIVLPIDVLKR